MWKLQVTAVTARYFSEEDPAPYAEPDCVAQISFQTNGNAFIHGAKSHPPIPPMAWRQLGRKIRDEYGVTTIKADRLGSPLDEPTNRLGKNNE